MMKRELTCIICPIGCTLTAELKEGSVTDVTGNGCPRGAEYAARECTCPERVLTTTAAVAGGGPDRPAGAKRQPVALYGRGKPDSRGIANSGRMCYN